MKLVITGGSGYLGIALARYFASEHEIVLVARSRPDARCGARFVVWDGQTLGDWARELDGADAVINLAGKSVNCRYNEANRRAILESRTRTTRLVAEAIQNAQNPPRAWLNASTATIYRDERSRDMDEESGVIGDGFSVEVARAWESALFEADLPHTRRVALRMSMIFGREAPVYEVFARLVKFGLGGPQGDGGQFVSWIHERDCVRAIQFLIEDEAISGAVNVCAPHPVPNREFLRVLRGAFKMPLGLPAPRPAMEVGAFLMQTETELPLKSRRVVPKRLLDAGFEFDFPTWRSAARDLVSKS